MNVSQEIKIPQQLQKHKDFALRISDNNEKIYSHIQYLKYLVQNIYELYRKMSKEILKLTEEYQRKMIKLNDATALSIINFIKGLDKIYKNINEQIINNTVSMNKKNQKVSKTRKDIIHEKLVKANQLFLVYVEKVQKYNKKQGQYQEDCQYFKSIEQDVIKFYSIKQNKSVYQKLIKSQVGIQQSLQDAYSLKIQLKSGLCELRLSLKQFFQMLGSNAQDDKKLLLIVRKKLRETKIFNETIIQEVNSEAEQSIKQSVINQSQLLETGGHQFGRSSLVQQYHGTFSNLSNQTSIFSDFREICQNIQLQEMGIELFTEFVLSFQKQIYYGGEFIDKIRESQEFQKFIDKKFQIIQILTNDMAENTELIKNQIADIRQIIQSVKALLEKKKVINQLKKYRHIKYQKFVTQVEALTELQKKRGRDEQLRAKYKQLKQKFAKGHLQLMRRFREMIQDMFREINQKFKYQRNYNEERKKIKNQFIRKKYYSLLMMGFFVNKEEAPKFQSNIWLKHYEKNITEDQLKKVGLLSQQHQKENKISRKGWGCCGIGSHTKRNKYVDQYNCALKNGIVLIQGKMKIHESYLKFVSSFNAKTIFGSTNIRIPKWDIQSIQKKYVLLSLVAIVQTKKGPISFTSFLTDPYDQLVQIYENRDNKMVTSKKLQTKQSIAVDKQNINDKFQKITDKTDNQTLKYTLQNSKFLKNTMLQLQQKFQCEIPQLLDKKIFMMESSSTYLSESKKQLSVSIQYHLINEQLNSKKYFFQIQIYDLNSKIQYKFVHQKSMEDEEIKAKLQKMAISIINSKTNNNSFTAALKTTAVDQGMKKQNKKQKNSWVKTKKQNELEQIDECSFIEKKQNLQFEFENDPSFVYVKQPSVSHTGQQPSFNYIPDLQIFKNIRSEIKIKDDSVNSSGKKSQQYLNRSKEQFSKQQIQEYLNSIDQKDLKKNLLNSKTKNQMIKLPKNEKKYEKIQNKQIQNKSEKQHVNSIFTLNNIILFLVLALGLNFLVSIFQ